MTLRGGFRDRRWRLGGFKGPSVAFRGVSRALGGVKVVLGSPGWYQRRI